MTREEHEKEIGYVKCCGTCRHYAALECRARTYMGITKERRPENVTITRDSGETLRRVMYFDVDSYEEEMRVTVDDCMMCALWQMNPEIDARRFLEDQP